MNNNLEAPQPASSEYRARTDRRNLSSKTAIYAMFRGRRRGHRREDDGTPHYTDVYDIRLLVATVGIVVLCCWDAFLTLRLLENGGRELNPFMDLLLGKGVDTFISVKIMLTSVCVVFLALHQNFPVISRYRVYHLIQALLIGYAVLIIYELVISSPHWLHA